MSDLAELAGWVTLSKSCIFSQAPLFSEPKEACDLAPSVFPGSWDGEQSALFSKKIQQDSSTNFLGFAERPQESVSEPLGSINCQEYVSEQAKEATGQAGGEIFGILQNQGKDPVPPGAFLLQLFQRILQAERVRFLTYMTRP